MRTLLPVSVDLEKSVLQQQRAMETSNDDSAVGIT